MLRGVLLREQKQDAELGADNQLDFAEDAAQPYQHLSSYNYHKMMCCCPLPAFLIRNCRGEGEGRGVTRSERVV
jgi:hypothetical protein